MDNIVTAKVGEERLLAVSDSNFFPEVKDSIHLEFGNNLHFFDIDTEQNVCHDQGGRHG